MQLSVLAAVTLLGLAVSDAALAELQRAPSQQPQGAAANAAPAMIVAQATTPPDPNAVEATDVYNAKVKANLEAVEARNQAALANYQAQTVIFEAQKKANEEAYAAQLAAHQAQVDAQQRKYEADLASWQARVLACKNGDKTQCAQ
jgi:hypothetical protein